MRHAILPGIALAAVFLLAVLPAVSGATLITATGTVTDANGNPVPGANVTLVDDSNHVLDITVTDVKGSFEFKEVATDRSGLVKVIATLARDGYNFSTRPENMQWYSPSRGPISFPAEELRLYDYPLSDHGYAWGIVTQGADSHASPDSTVYLSNATINLSMRVGSMGAFLFEVSPGEYELYAVHDEGPYQFNSKRTRITVLPAHDYLQSAPINLLISPNIQPTPTVTGEVAAIGTVTGANGEPIAGANVSLIDDSYHTLGVTLTDPDGNFIFRDLNTSGSYVVKALVTYYHDGQKFTNRLENMNWYDAAGGPFSFVPEELRLYDYPLSSHGYIWGIVIDDTDYDRLLDSTVYLYNSTVNLSTRTGSTGAFMFAVFPGEYEIYAIHDEGAYRIVSNRTRISISPVHDYLQSAPMTIAANQKFPAGVVKDMPSVTVQVPHSNPTENPPATTEQKTPAEPLKVAPLAVALILGLVAIAAGWTLLRHRK